MSEPHQFNSWEEAISLGLFRGKLNRAAFMTATALKLNRQCNKPLNQLEVDWLAHEATPDDLREVAKFLAMKSDNFNKYRLHALKSYAATFRGPRVPGTFQEVKKHFDASSGLRCANSSLRRILQSMNLPVTASKRGRPKK